MSKASFSLDNYKDVPTRIAEFREAHPDGRLRPADLSMPYRIETIEGETFIVYVAAAYRNELDNLPGIGMAWEPFPGKTSYTKDSELQNAETSAWGRAIVAALKADTRTAPIASREEVQARQGDNGQAPRDNLATDPQLKAIKRLCDMLGGPIPWMYDNGFHPLPEGLTKRQASTIIDKLNDEPKPEPAERRSTLRTTPYTPDDPERPM